MSTITLDRTFSSPSLTKRLVRYLSATDTSSSALIARIALALVFLPHGAQKVSGWFGGSGFEATMSYFQSLGIPYVFGLLAIAAEVLGSVALLVGLATRVAAFGIAANMFVAAVMVHLPFGFFMNWFGNQKGEGVEYHVLAIALAVTVMITGGGRLSVDRLITTAEPRELRRES